VTARPDVLVVSLGTTKGLRIADEGFAQQLRQAGATTALAAVGIGLTDRLRRGYPVNDLVEALAARRTIASAVAREPPRAVVVSTTTATLLMPPLDVPFAIRFDSPAVLNRLGVRNAVLHVLERRRLDRAALLLPASTAAAAPLSSSTETIVVPIPVRPTTDAPLPGPRERVAVAYAPDPRAKGLDLLVAAWAEATGAHGPTGAHEPTGAHGPTGARGRTGAHGRTGAPAATAIGSGAGPLADARLDVYGIEPAVAQEFLARRGVAVPPSVRWRGMVPASEFRAELRGATAFVSAARWEDYGQAALEAMADGTLPVLSPAGGAYEALPLARALDPGLVAADLDPASLAQALRHLFSLPEQVAAGLRVRAAATLRDYAPERVVERLAADVLPRLLPS
jgi:glycosyltransferase involved in cell wall biosynthesis